MTPDQRTRIDLEFAKSDHALLTLDSNALEHNPNGCDNFKATPEVQALFARCATYNKIERDRLHKEAERGPREQQILNVGLAAIAHDLRFWLI